jgi:HK97 gp10 family phage protein
MSHVTSNASLVSAALATARERALEHAGLAMESYAKALCPVDTGNLRNSISHAHDDNTVVVGTNVEYAPHVELGTVRQRAQPYLVPAVRDHADTLKSIIRIELSTP